MGLGINSARAGGALQGFSINKVKAGNWMETKVKDLET
jgi:hypothetical protein